MTMDERAIKIVHDYILDRTVKLPIGAYGKFEVYIVWKCKTLQNWKYLLSTTLYDGMYYELTFDGDKDVWYLDAYRKQENRVIKNW